MRNEILREILAEYEQVKQDNMREEARRRREVEARQPQIIDLMEERQRMLNASVMGVLSGAQADEQLPRRMEMLNGRIEALLCAAGWDAHYLDPIYRCRACRDTGYTGEPVREMCDCLKGRFYQRLYRAVGLSENAEQSFERFDPQVFSDAPLTGRSYSQRQLMGRIRQVCEKWADEYPAVQQPDLLLMGQSGLGKTYLMHAMARRLLERGRSVLLISAYRFLEVARKAYFSGNTTDLDMLLEAEILMVDDMGSEPLMENITIVQWFNLINERQSRGLSTVISTNLRLDELRTRYTERIASRLTDQEQCLLVQFLGQDVRRS